MTDRLSMNVPQQINPQGAEPCFLEQYFCGNQAEGGLFARKHVVHTCVPFLLRGSNDRDKALCF